MAVAKAARATEDLQETFSEQTRLRDEISAMQRLLKATEMDDIPDTLRQDIKERVQEVLATTAENLYLLSGSPTT